MKKKKKIQIRFINNSAHKKVISIDKKSLELYAQIMGDIYGKV